MLRVREQWLDGTLKMENPLLNSFSQVAFNAIAGAPYAQVLLSAGTVAEALEIRDVWTSALIALFAVFARSLNTFFLDTISL